MTATGARPPRRTYREFIRVEGDAVIGKFVIVSYPHPLHHATVTKEGSQRSGWSWVVRYPTFGIVPTKVYDSMSKALNDASDAVGRRAGTELMRYDKDQRYAMGQQQCPHRDRGHPRLCGQAASPGMVWCDDHRGGKSKW
jgi:hypothetical protein